MLPLSLVVGLFLLLVQQAVFSFTAEALPFPLVFTPYSTHHQIHQAVLGEYLWGKSHYMGESHHVLSWVDSKRNCFIFGKAEFYGDEPMFIETGRDHFISSGYICFLILKK